MLQKAIRDLDLDGARDFLLPHWRRIWSTNPIERLNREVKRRTDVVGRFPNPAALLRLSSSVLIEAYDEWTWSPGASPGGPGRQSVTIWCSVRTLAGPGTGCPRSHREHDGWHGAGQPPRVSRTARPAQKD